MLGASGTGKSSLVKAGLIPYIKRNRGQQWHILKPIRPGESPLKALYNTLNQTLFTDNLLLNTEAHVVNWLQQNPQSKLMLVIDQAEELFTLCRNEQEREDFLKLFAVLVANNSDNLRVVLSLRSDFEPQLSNSALEPYWYSSRVPCCLTTGPDKSNSLSSELSTATISP
ncbi:MAG: ATP-binding protein [Chlorogloeopsis fritschii C42_A2020_084]|uniref:ATP-binding protein n=1 Tax=Chlorogloeopsis fritschii TaxID=1124 RepID=UPI001A027EA9|nr:ATP-binding protein [Chlorogloeopsis fritschii]MBF2009378.1 ATP-binding protein [Chlorogloeopsis fritschii C42_A2020_084]